MDKPMSTSEFFLTICSILSDRNALPEDMLDGVWPGTEFSTPIRTPNFFIHNDLNRGPNGGLMLKIFLELNASDIHHSDIHMNKESEYILIGTFFTESTSGFAVDRMSALLADFIKIAWAYKDTHYEDFLWTGYSVWSADSAFKNYCATEKDAFDRKDNLVSFTDVCIQNNATHEIFIYPHVDAGMAVSFDANDFENFKSNVCHTVKDMGDLKFVEKMLMSDAVIQYFSQGEYEKALYLVGMVDYLSRKNDIAVCSEYDVFRQYKFGKPIYPVDIKLRAAAAHDTKILDAAFDHAIPEFRRFNIIENEVENVC